MIAHRFAFAVVHGVTELSGVQVLGHRCDNPLCQRVGRGHVVASSYVENRREWALRKELTGSPLGDPRGSRRRARELRDLARQDPAPDRHVSRTVAVTALTSGAGLPGVLGATQPGPPPQPSQRRRPASSHGRAHRRRTRTGDQAGGDRLR